MAKIRINAAGQTEIRCPGCLTTHTLNTDRAKSPCWEFNGDFEKPTLSPSVRTRSGHYCKEDQKVGDCWCDYADRYPMAEKPKFNCYICHSFVRDGMIEFLSDCTHDKAGQTLPLLDFGEV